MSTKIIVVGVLLVAVLYLATRQPAPQKNATASSSNSLLTLGAGVLAFAEKLTGAPSKTPDLATSKAAADNAVSMGLPVTQTQGNGLMTPSFLDGSSLVTYNDTEESNAILAGAS